MAEAAMKDVSKIYGEDVNALRSTSCGIREGFRMVVVPLAALTAAVLALIHSWSEFLIDERTRPVVAIPNFVAAYTVDYGARAAVVVVMVPLVVIGRIFRRRVFFGPSGW